MRRRGRHQAGTVVLTRDQAEIALVALDDAGLSRRARVLLWCAPCEQSLNGVCLPHATDLRIAGECAEVARAISGQLPEKPGPVMWP